jgi:CSLREA domain-containing protein
MSFLIRFSCAMAAALALSIAFTAPQRAYAATFTVNSIGDTSDAAPGNGVCADSLGACTLRAAIQEANFSAENDTINFSVTGTINLMGALQDILSNVAINGPGSTLLTVRRDTGGDYRIFTIDSGRTVTLSGLTVMNGKTPDGAPGPTSGGQAGNGGGILNAGVLTLTDMVVTANFTGNGGNAINPGTTFGGPAGYGGGVSSSGSLTMTNVTVSNNTTGHGGNGGFGHHGGRGGGIQATGTLTMTQCAVLGNNTGTGGVGSNAGASGGGGGDGAGILAETGTFNLTNIIVNGNHTGNGAGESGTGGHGGGILVIGTATLTNSTVSSNTTGNGSAGFVGQGGLGGGIYNGGALTIMGSTIDGNSTGTSGPNGGSNGGGILNGATLKIINSTVSGNSTTSVGGGLSVGGTTTLTNVTVTNNRSDSDNNGWGPGGGIYSFSGTLTLNNTMVAANFKGSSPSTTADDIDAPVQASSSYNLIGTGGSGGLTNGVNNNQVGVANALLGALTDNGGPTRTHALLSGSPALDAGDNSLAKDANNNTLTSDQRGTGRFANSAGTGPPATVDIGAFEFQPSVEDVSDKTTNEDTSLSFPFSIGDTGVSISSVTASSDNQALVPNANLTVTNTGPIRTLQIIPGANQFGAATITLTVTPTTGPNMSDTFLLTVTPVNDAPTFTKGANQTVSEDSGPHVVANWATGIGAGPNESGQSLSFFVTGNTNPGLFSTGPAVGSDGSLTYTPAPNASGGATITLVLKDDGGTANGGQDTSAGQTFTINVTGVNDGPVNSIPGPQTTSQNTSRIFSSTTFNLISVGDVDAGIDPVVVTLSATNGTLTLSRTSGLTFLAGDGANDATMTFLGTLADINLALNGLTFKPVVGFYGLAGLQITTGDQGHNGSGGAMSDTAAVAITVNPGGTLQFSSPTFETGETGIVTTITVTRINGSSGTASVNYTTSNGTATGGNGCGAGNDYASTASGLVWADGDTAPKSILVPICDDSLNEENEFFNLTLSGPTGSGTLGQQITATLTIVNDDAPVLLTEENTERAVALDLVNQTRDPFSLTNPFNLSLDQRRRVSLFVWRLGLLPSDDASALTAQAEDDEARIYPLTVEYVGAVPSLNSITQVVVRLPDQVVGAPRDLWVKVGLRGPSSNRAIIKIAAP